MSPVGLPWRVVLVASLVSVLGAFSGALASNLKDIVEASGAGISWQEFGRLIGPERMNGLVRIGSALARSKPADAWPSVQALPPGDDGSYLMEGVLLEQAERNPAAGLRELAGLTAEGERNMVARAFFGRWAASAPAKAADAVARFSGTTRDVVLEAALTAWSASDAPAAARWASHLPATENRPPEQLATIGMAGSESLVGVHYDRGQAMQLAAFEWAKRDKRAALAWAGSVADPALRAVLVRLVTQE
jgi:hypothetical protein